MNDVSWGALALTLTLIGCLWTWWAWRNRGTLAGVRGVAWTMLPVAAWLTGILPLIGQVVTATSQWATRLVFSPVVWAGVSLAGVSFTLLVVTGIIGRRRSPDPLPEASTTDELPPARKRKRGSDQGSDQEGPGGTNDEFADIEALLRQRGIQ